MVKKKNEITIRSSAAEYLTYVASVGDQQDSIEMRIYFCSIITDKERASIGMLQRYLKIGTSGGGGIGIKKMQTRVSRRMFASQNLYRDEKTILQFGDYCYPFLTMQRYKTDFIYQNKIACFFAE